MRRALVVLALLLASLPSAHAQMASPILTWGEPATQPSVEANTTELAVYKLSRTCPNGANVLKGGPVQIHVHAPRQLVEAGAVQFLQQVCATQPKQTVDVPVSITAPADTPAEGEQLVFTLQAKYDGYVLDPGAQSGPAGFAVWLGEREAPADARPAYLRERDAEMAATALEPTPPLDRTSVIAVFLLLVGAVVAGSFRPRPKEPARKA